MEERVLSRRYRLLEHVGGGGMADVYKAHDDLLDRTVAVKVLHSQFANDTEFVDKFHREARGAAKLVHQNIVNIYDVGEDQGTQYIVMEYVAGCTLKDKIQQEGRLEPAEAVRIASGIAGALESAHRNNLVHCDIKPHNILVMEDGNVKVADFGIARAVSSSTMTYGGSVMGSVHYFSPEQAKGTSITTKSDVYSLGVVLYEMLTGALPYNGETPVSIALKHLQEEPTPIRQLVPSVPAVLEAVVQKSMNKDPMLRPDSHELLADLEQAMLVIGGKSAAGRFGQPGDPFATQAIPRINPDTYGNGSPGVDSQSGHPQSTSYYGRTTDSDTDSEESAKSMFKSRKFVFGLLAILVLGFFVGSFMSYGKFWSSAEVEVPNVVGRTTDVAKQMIEDRNLRVKLAETFDANVPVGQVVSQYPEAGSKVKEQRVVTIYISKGGEEVTMPDLKNLSRMDAEEKLSRMGLRVGSVHEEASSSKAGTVLSQSPQAGAKAIKGQSVSLVVSKGEDKTITLSDYTGMTVDSARSNLSANKLVLGSVVEQPSDKPAGTVIGQNPASGSRVKAGDSVSLTVAGPQRSPAVKPTDPGTGGKKASPDQQSTKQ